jgi:DNA-binding response OmpR family regulator
VRPRRVARDPRRPAHQALPIIILTSSREDRDIIDGYGLGANSYIVKPVDHDTLGSIRKKHLRAAASRRMVPLPPRSPTGMRKEAGAVQ